MPLALIESCRTRTDDEVAHLLQAVYEAQLAAFNVPPSDRQSRYVEHSPKWVLTPPDSSDNFILITIQMFPGRSAIAKQVFYQEILKRLGALGIHEVDVFIGLHESPVENWCIRNGRPAP
ncbi:hypothetical protein CI807_18550 [Pseudomonas sp. NS1(2017)]|jgi:5-carboxymethyl-2-hydroxymuconate isomerase|uniref:Tautomerase family protein n=1 Tax=Pseudomonas reactans TaxID=117680 RepID=A0ABX2QXG1_9PSED|nr:MULTISPECIES: tautomerase family protein [Pseudomonas]ASV38095.1 hypothetical protein CI807_18550 [Pseudomonas sp. NS1(2017)]NWA41126.1 tautomerase family protein [Pseudomonas reactans]NWC89699.1 tautomerase family protein [Pseudomonas reactans]NWD31962.1 tautomerase family protein [Pseudomonas reactans]NWD96504.1 tautomerase family protein [Pseudomonas reactans]